MAPLSTVLLCIPAGLMLIVCACGLAVLPPRRRPRRSHPSSGVMHTGR
jgi:hypothetical protein